MKRCIISFIVLVMLITLGDHLNNVVYAQEESTSTTIEFTEEEQEFIRQHPIIYMGVDPEFMPYEFIDSDGKYKGIAADYRQLISRKIGITMIVQPGKTWAEAYEMAVEKDIDVLPCVAKTTERQQYFLYSDPYYIVQRVIVVQDSNDDFKSMEDLKYTTVAVQKNSSHNSYLKGIHEINLSLYKTPLDAITAVSKGDETSFVGYLATSAYLIESNGLTNLKYVAIGNQEEQQHLYFAVRNDWPLLVSIINKGLASITEEEKMVINDKWVGITNEVDYSFIKRIIVAISGIIILVIIISFFWIVRLKKEISKRIMIENELNLAKLEAENANVIKSTFLARMSHEIRTPLNAIMGMSYLLKKSGIPFSQKVYVDKINEAAHTMLDVINDILDFSKIESGKIEIELNSFNLDKVIQQVISIISFKIEEQNIGFAFVKDPKIPSYFIGDSKRIEQVLLNLLTNAVKFTNKGEVSLNVKLRVNQDNQDNQDNIYLLEFAIKDSGIGMSKEQKDQLFKPFVQADSSINRRFGGTGLGLSIVKSFTDLMNGSVSVYSEEGRGSTFTVVLPLQFDDNKDYEKKKNEAFSYLQKIQALVLVKNVTLKTLLDTYLQNFGIHATFVKEVSDAHKLLKTDLNSQQESYNLFVMDYDILTDESFEFTNEILEDLHIPTKPKVIMLIPMNREDLYEQIEMNGLNLGIVKPIIPSVLYDGILEIFNRIDLINCDNQTLISSEERKAKENHKVLVVDDNKTNQFIAKCILEQAGVSVALASNGEEGVAYFMKYSSDISLILMDLHMPVLNGYEASIQIREHNKLIPIVAMTADAITGVEEQCEKAGIYQYISKPFEPDIFIQTILNILDNVSSPELKENTKIDYKSEETLYINQEEALKLLGNNIQLYRMVLMEFYKETEAIFSELEKEMKDNNLIEAANIIHKVKGSSGNIGAKKLYETAMMLQKALEKDLKEDIYQLYSEFEHLLNASRNEIMQIIQEKK